MEAKEREMDEKWRVKKNILSQMYVWHPSLSLYQLVLMGDGKLIEYLVVKFMPDFFYINQKGQTHIHTS